MEHHPYGQSRLKRLPGTALHRQLYIVLRDQILRGVFAPGSAIPTETELEGLYGVSRITVRRAVADLEAHRFVSKVPSKGTFVLPRAQSARPEATQSLIGNLTRQAEETQVKVLVVETVAAPPAIASSLELALDQRAHHALRLRSSGKTPLLLTEAWLQESLAPLVTRESLMAHALFEIVMQNGVQFGKVVQEISAVLASPQEADLLETDVGGPLIKVTRLFYALDGLPAYHLTTMAVPERTRLLMEIPADAIRSLSAGTYQHSVPA